MSGANFKMDELKTKFLDLIHLPNNSKIPIVGFSIEEPQVDVEKKDLTVSDGKKDERPSDQEILESIDPKYFASEGEFDLGRYELEKFASSDMEKIESGLKYLKEQQLVVSNHVLQMILEKQSACQEEFERITQIQNEVNQVLNGVKNGRSKLGVATRHFTTASLGILANYRKRMVAQKLLYYLNTIKTLHKTESKLRELLNSGDYPSAIALLLECQNVASTYKHFSCVAALSLKLKETLEMAEEKLDNKLAEMCCGFDENVYEKLQSAYSLLGKTQIAMDQFPMHFTSAVQTTASNIVHSFINQKISQEIQYSEMCKEVSEENFIPCLLTLCKSLWVIVLSYHQVVAWHQKNARNKKEDDFESNLNEEQVKKKLHKGYSRLWHDVQTRVSLLVMAADLSFFKIDDFLQVLGILHRLTQIGEEFCESESEEVTSSIRSKSSDYFISYHSARMDDLKVFLENEAWTQCPVRSDFSLLHLEEFRGIRLSVEQCAGVSSRLDSSFDSSSTGMNFFTRFPHPESGTPFDSRFQVDSREEDIMQNIPDEAMAYYSEDSEEEEESKPRKNKGPLLSNTTLTVLRSCGKYLQMARLLKSISSEVIVALVQLFEYYLYTVHSFFSSDMPVTLCGNSSSPKLLSVLVRIKENLIVTDEGEESNKVLRAMISPMVNLNSLDTLYGLSERVVAVESLIFLSQEYTLLKPYLEKLIPPQSTSLNLNQFYSQTIPIINDVRKSVYACVSWRTVDIKQTLSMMSKVDWEVKEVMNHHSKYVDFMLDDIEAFDKRLKEVKKNIFIPDQALKVIWDCLILLLSNIFVEGYVILDGIQGLISRQEWFPKGNQVSVYTSFCAASKMAVFFFSFASSKKCSGGGRGLMQFDFAQIEEKLVKKCQIHPLPHKEFVESYIRVYYHPEEEYLEKWIKDHQEYTSKQLIALVSCACQSNKKARQKLILLIEELDKKR